MRKKRFWRSGELHSISVDEAFGLIQVGASVKFKFWPKDLELSGKVDSVDPKLEYWKLSTSTVRILQPIVG